MKKALIVWGGWDGHQPKEVAEIFAACCERKASKSRYPIRWSFRGWGELKALDLIVPVWTMGQIEQQLRQLSAAVQSGVGIGRLPRRHVRCVPQNVEWQFMTGGQWVAHPGNDGVRNTRKHSSTEPTRSSRASKISKSSPSSITCMSIRRLKCWRRRRFPGEPVDMPVVWTKRWGHGRVYYNSLGTSGGYRGRCRKRYGTDAPRFHWWAAQLTKPIQLQHGKNESTGRNTHEAKSKLALSDRQYQQHLFAELAKYFESMEVVACADIDVERAKEKRCRVWLRGYTVESCSLIRTSRWSST